MKVDIDMNMSKQNILEFFDLDPLSVDKYKLLPIESLPGSVEIPYQPEPYCIYIGSEYDPFPDSVPVKKIYMALGTDVGMRAGYNCIEMLESDAFFDAAAREETKNLYLFLEEDQEHIMLLRHNGTEWVDTSRKKDLVLDILESHDKQKVWRDPKIIKKITVLYSCYLLEGELDNLELNDLNVAGLKEKIIGQMLSAGHIPKQILAVENIPAGDGSSAQKKRKHDDGTSTIANGRHVRRRLEFGSQNTSNEENSPNISGLSPVHYNYTFFSTPPRNLEKNQGEVPNLLAALKARVQAGNGTREDNFNYARLLLEGGEGVERNPQLAQVFFEFADELPEAPVASQAQNANKRIASPLLAANPEVDLTAIWDGPNPFALEDNPDAENASRLSPSF